MVMNSLVERIRARNVTVGVIGLGYVGLPLAVEFARAGFRVTGFDVDATKARSIRSGENASRKSTLARTPPCSSIGRTTSSVVPG
jgi:UDP-N-acetyl-D-glucosamine dehydrogenase